MAHLSRPATWFERLAHSPIVLAVFVIAALFLLKKSWDLFGEANTAHTAAQAAQAQYESLRARETQLQQKIGRLDTSEGVDATIREKFGLVRDGEEMVVVVLPQDATATSSVEGVRGLWYKLLQFLK